MQKYRFPFLFQPKPGSRGVAVITANGKSNNLTCFWNISLIMYLFFFRALGCEINCFGVQFLQLLVRNKSGRLFCFWLSTIIGCRREFILSRLYRASGMVLAFSTQNAWHFNEQSCRNYSRNVRVPLPSEI